MEAWGTREERWTQEERRRVLSYMRHDLTAREWATIMDVSAACIHSDGRAIAGAHNEHPAMVVHLMGMAGLSSNELAERWDIAPCTVMGWRNGHDAVPLHRLERLAKLAGATLTTGILEMPSRTP